MAVCISWKSGLSRENVDPASAWMRTDLLSVVARNLSIATDVKSELLAMVIILIPAFLAMWKFSGDRDKEETRSLEQAVVFLAIPTCIYYLSYDLLLLFPAVVLAVSGRIFTTQKHARWYRTVYIALLAIPLMNYFATHSVMERFHIKGVLRELAISLTPLALLAANIMLWLAVIESTPRGPRADVKVLSCPTDFDQHKTNRIAL